jgi:hypothetical protein
MDIDLPTCRATIRAGRVTLNRWRPGLVGCGGPEPAAARTIDAALADLRRLDDDELIVSPLAGLRWTADDDEAIVRWAALAGYRRVWLPSLVVDLDGRLAPLADATADCPTCGARWQDGSVAFWERVRAVGWFPGTCLACGGSLPEWTVDGAGADGATARRFGSAGRMP